MIVSEEYMPSNLVLTILGAFVVSITGLLWTYYPTIKKKYSLYQMSKKLYVSGENINNLTQLDLTIRMIKKLVKEDSVITKGEEASDIIRDVASFIVGDKNPEVYEKYFQYSPGLIFDQHPNGYSCRIEGDSHDCILMSSLSYWSFHANQEVQDYAFKKVKETGTGNHGSYLVIGKNTVVEESYDEMKKFFKRKYCIYSASGFLACMNLIANICSKGGVIFMDEKSHVCLRYGSKLAGSKLFRFPHQNYNKLREIMRKERHKFSGKAYLVVDSIYSADGTVVNLPRARQICDEFDVEIVMDEAHSLGTLGATGHGIEEYFNMYGACDYICGVFSKTLSSYGGFVVSNNEYVNVLNISPGVGFACGPHSFSVASVTKALQIIDRDNGKVRADIDKLRLFYVEELRKIKCANILHCGHNVFVSYPHVCVGTTIAIEMRKKGFLVSAFMFPSVPMDRSILRLTLHPLMTKEIISDFCQNLGECMVELKERFGHEVLFGRNKQAYYDELHPPVEVQVGDRKTPIDFNVQRLQNLSRKLHYISQLNKMFTALMVLTY